VDGREDALKLGIVSDIHCNIEGLNQALELMGPVDDLLCLGDSIFEYRFSNEVVEKLRELGAHTIQGNHEEVFLGPLGARAREREGIDKGLLQWLADRPARMALHYGNRKVLMVHSTPWEPRGTYVYPHSPLLERFGEEDADFVLYGHTHQQLVRRFGDTLVVNPGSTGDGRDQRNDRQLSYAILDTETAEVEVIDFPDPARANLQAAMGRG
jgi:putative phosphoesterase